MTVGGSRTCTGLSIATHKPLWCYDSATGLPVSLCLEVNTSNVVVFTPLALSRSQPVMTTSCTFLPYLITSVTTCISQGGPLLTKARDLKS